MNTIKRLLIAVLISFVALIGCGDDDDDAKDNNDSLPDEGYWVEHYEVFFAFENAYFTLRCECAYDDIGFSSEEECLDQRTMSDSEIAEFAGCIQSVADDLDDPPESIKQTFDCEIENTIDAHECVDGVEEDHDPVCTDDGLEALSTCDDTAHPDDGQCDAYIEGDDDAQAWFDDLSDGIQNHCR